MNYLEAIQMMALAKRQYKDCFMQATLTVDCDMRQWNGHTEKVTEYTVPAGSRVIVTMLSRFGDVGIRGKNINKAQHGYDARIDPEKLENWEVLNN